MNKTEFPLGVELPLRGGGVAVLYEFFDGYWYGRANCTSPRQNEEWFAASWQAVGRHFNGPHMEIMKPKRKAWVVWADGEAVAVVPTKDEALEAALRVEYQRNMRNDPRIQEITEP